MNVSAGSDADGFRPPARFAAPQLVALRKFLSAVGGCEVYQNGEVNILEEH